MVEFILWFGGGALAYGTIVTLVILLGARALRGAVPWASAPLILCTSTFVFLTQHPFPNPADLVCPVPSAAPQWQLFRFMTPIRALAEVDTPLTGWLTSRWVMATVMNFVVCCVIGLCWAGSGRALWSAPLFGLGVSLACEVTQLTGIWGIYPCAYRGFNVDDLLLNTLGVAFGAALYLGVSRAKTS